MRLLIAIVLLLVGSTCFASTYYVATTGNDANDGDIDHPWLTISKARTVAVSGDVINIAPGTYTGYEETSVPTRTDYITYKGYGGTPTLSKIYVEYATKGNAYLMFEDVDIYNDNIADLVSITNADYIIINNCGISADKWYYNSSNAVTGISLDDSDHVTISGSHFSDIGQGVSFVDADYVTISGNWMQIKGGTPVKYLGGGSNITVSANNITGETFVPYPTDPEAFEDIHQSAVSIRGDGITISGNYFSSLANGIMTYIPDVAGGEDSYDDILIENNVIHGVESGTAMRFYNAGDNIVIRNNSVFAQMYAGSCSDGTASDARYRYSTALMVATLASGESGADIKLYNNILAGTVYAPDTITDTNNIYWSLANMSGTFRSTPIGAGSTLLATSAGSCGVFPDDFSTTAIFAQAIEPVGASYNMGLSAGSSAINYGDATYQPSTSLGLISNGYVGAGNPRDANAHSAGAFEMSHARRFRATLTGD